MFSYEFCKISKNTFLQNTCRRLLLSFGIRKTRIVKLQAKCSSSWQYNYSYKILKQHVNCHIRQCQIDFLFSVSWKINSMHDALKSFCFHLKKLMCKKEFSFYFIKLPIFNFIKEFKREIFTIAISPIS